MCRFTPCSGERRDSTANHKRGLEEVKPTIPIDKKKNSLVLFFAHSLTMSRRTLLHFARVTTRKKTFGFSWWGARAPRGCFTRRKRTPRRAECTLLKTKTWPSHSFTYRTQPCAISGLQRSSATKSGMPTRNPRPPPLPPGVETFQHSSFTHYNRLWLAYEVTPLG